MKVVFINIMVKQFAKLTLDQVIRDYQLGFITATGLVRYWVKITMGYGWDKTKTAKEFCETLGISKTAFYKAIALLKTLGYINFESHGKITITNTELENEPILSNEGTNTNKESVPDCKQTIRKRGKSSQIVNSLSAIEENKNLKPTQDVLSSSPTDLFQLSFNFLQAVE